MIGRLDGQAMLVSGLERGDAMTTRRRVFSAQVGGTPQGAFNLNVSAVPQPTDIPRTTNPNMDPNFIGMNITNGDLGSYAYLVHVDFDVFQSTGSTRTYTLYLFRGSSANPGGVAFPNQSAGKVTVPTGQSGEWGASWIVSPPAPGLSTNNTIRVRLAADTNHVVQFQGCKFRIERLES
jgi:hypothetical protein